MRIPELLSTYHERDRETGYDNRGARLYDSEIGRFLGVDPMAGKFQNHSPYNYVLGNPVRLVDPDGAVPQDPIPSEHYSFLTGAGLDVYSHVRANGLSISGALTALAHASFESEYGRGKGAAINNYFGFLYGSSDGTYSAHPTIKTSHGPMRNYLTLKDGVDDYLGTLGRNWPDAITLFESSEVTAEGIDEAFKIGLKGGYTNTKGYGKTLLGTRRSVQRRIINDLTIYSDLLSQQISAQSAYLNSGTREIEELSGWSRLFANENRNSVLGGLNRNVEEKAQADKAKDEIETTIE